MRGVTFSVGGNLFRFRPVLGCIGKAVFSFQFSDLSAKNTAENEVFANLFFGVSGSSLKISDFEKSLIINFEVILYLVES